jgi:hypothetical protein
MKKLFCKVVMSSFLLTVSYGKVQVFRKLIFQKLVEETAENNRHVASH